MMGSLETLKILTPIIKTLVVLSTLPGSIVMCSEPLSYQPTVKNVTFLAQPAPSSSSRGGMPNTLGDRVNSGDSLPMPQQAGPVRGSISDQDLSAAINPPRRPRSLSQFASSSQTTRSFRPTNIFGDFFGGGGGMTTLNIPIVYKNVPGFVIGNSNAIGFNVGGPALDLFSVGAPQGVSNLIEPTNPTGAYVPNADGLNGFTFQGGTATFVGSGLYDITYFNSSLVSLPSNTSSLLGRQKIAENVSPFPQNRIYANYSYFNNTPLGNGRDVRRWSPGFESLVYSENTSIELRLPMAMTLDSNQFAGDPVVENYEIGNLYFAIKRLIYQGEYSGVSVGTSLTLPTGDDINVYARSNTFGTRRILNIENQSVHILPFIGGYLGDKRFFVQGFSQLDIDTNGNSVNYNANFLNGDLNPIGRFQDATFLYLDGQFGTWLKRLEKSEYSSSTKNQWTGIAIVSELHLSRSLNSEDRIVYPGAIAASNSRQDVQILNTLVGVNLEYNFRSSFNFGYATPIGNGADRDFQSEGRFSFNRYY